MAPAVRSPASPVKTRATRSRAAAKKAATTSEMDAPPRKAVISKAAATRRAKITAEIGEPETVAVPARRTTKKEVMPMPAPLAAAPRRRVKVTPLDAPIEPEPVPEVVVEEEPEPKATRVKKSTATTKTKSAATKVSASVPATKSRSKKAIPTEEPLDETLPAPKTRGRPKRTVDAQEKQASTVEAPVRQTRTRAGSGAAATQPTISSTAAKTAAARKKVTFQDMPEIDKENIPLVSKRAAGKKTATTTTTGIRAKPVRKATATTTRRKGTAAKEDNPAPQALTPKKITQIARSSTPDDSEEDELSGSKTPIRDLSVSPRRLPGRLAGLSSPVKKLDFTAALLTRSPQRDLEAAPSMLSMSPARRAPPTPFKDALKESPGRADAVPIFPVHSLQSSSTIFTAPTTAQSMLLQSPKRGPLDSSVFARSTLKPQASPFKASLLQSPARRLFSPQKPKNNAATSARLNITSPQTSGSSNTAASCHLRAFTSPERLNKVHTLTEEELAHESDGLVDFDESILHVRSPMKLVKNLQLPVTTADKNVETELIIPNHLDQAPVESTTPTKEPMDVVPDRATNYNGRPERGATEGGPTSVIGPELEIEHVHATAHNVMFRASRFREDDESSEDELAADMTPARSFLTGRPSLPAANFRSRLSTGISGVPQGVGFTPLAAQLSGWRAGSPEKQGIEPSSGMFSPVATQHIPGSVQVSRQSTPQQLKSSGGLRRSVAARSSMGVKKSPGPRLSLVSSAVGTPGKSFFAEEMALRELGQQYEERENQEEDLDLHAAVEESMPQFTVDENPEGEAGDVSDNSVTGDATGDELTTDLINQTMYSDTALVDMAALAKEAEDLAPPLEHNTQLSSSSSVYGDENSAPLHMQVMGVDNPATDKELVSKTPARSPAPAAVPLNDIDTATPVRPDLSLPRFVNTVISKVPLRPEGDISPIKMPKKRSLSFSAQQAPSSAKKPAFSLDELRLPKARDIQVSASPQRQVRSSCPSPTASTPGQRSFAVDDFGDSTLDGIELPEDEFVSDDEEPFFEDRQSVQNTPKSAITTRTPLKAVGTGVLHGAIVYVDVHTTEGADASSIFVELLTQMGAKCVKDWRWNSRASLAGGEISVSTSCKIGITHVVYKDGGKRTLEKLRDAKGQVWCVGVGWVLDCEREAKWLDEASYAVDTSVVPRGGSRRRKSMEPRALMNANGSLGVVNKGRRSVSAEITVSMRGELVGLSTTTPAAKKPLPLAARSAPPAQRQSLDSDVTSLDSGFSTPTGVLCALKTRRSVNSASAPASTNDEEEEDEDENLPPPATPTGYVAYDPAADEALSPATPYLIGAGAKLLQMSCPPKQSGEGIFEDAGKGKKREREEMEGKAGEGMRRRLEAARRRTMGWRPRVGSPLARDGKA